MSNGADPLRASNPQSLYTIISPRTGWIEINWRELWESRELLAYLILRDVTVRYKQTVLGVAWAILQPIASVVIFSLVFGRLAAMPSDGQPYPVFVYAGLLPWMFFSNAVSTSSQSLVNQQALLTKIYLPRLFVPAAAIGGGLVDLFLSFIVFFLLMAFYGIWPTWNILFLPALVAMTVAASFGIGLVLASITVTYRDFRYVIPFMVQIWLYLSPVIYPVSIVPQQWRWILSLNPMVGIIDGFRASLLGTPFDYKTLGVSMGITGFLLVYGLFYFRKTERRFADIA